MIGQILLSISSLLSVLIPPCVRPRPKHRMISSSPNHTYHFWKGLMSFPWRLNWNAARLPRRSPLFSPCDQRSTLHDIRGRIQPSARGVTNEEDLSGGQECGPDRQFKRMHATVIRDPFYQLCAALSPSTFAATDAVAPLPVSRMQPGCTMTHPSLQQPRLLSHLQLQLAQLTPPPAPIISYRGVLATLSVDNYASGGRKSENCERQPEYLGNGQGRASGRAIGLAEELVTSEGASG